MGVYPLGSCTMKHNPRINEKMARLPGIGDLHPLQPVSTVQGALELIDRAGALAEDADRHAGRGACRPAAGAHGEMCGMMAIARRPRGRAASAPAQDRAGARIRRTAPIPATAAALGFTVKPIPANDRGRVDLAALKAAARPRRRGDHADQPQHLRPVRARDHRDRRGRARGRRLLLLRRRQLQRHRRPGAAGRPRRRLPCTSTCTRPSRRRMAAAGRARVRWCCRRRWRPLRPLPGSCMDGDGLALVEERRRRSTASRSAGSRPSTARWACSSARWPTCMSHGADGLRQVAEDAVLNANYVMAAPEGRDDARPSRAPACTRRCSTTASSKDTGVTHARFRQGDDRRGLSTR